MVGVEVFELPVDAALEGFVRAYEVNVPTERGTYCIVDVKHDLLRDEYAVEWSGELLDQSPQAVTATVQLVMLAIRERRTRDRATEEPADAN